MKKRGILIAFEGIDQSGKGTQSKLLVNRLNKMGYKAEYMHFHDANTPLGNEIQMFLDGKRNFSPIVRQLLYTANRYERAEYIETKLNEQDFLIIDRYISSGIAYGLANDLDMDWMIHLESKLPQPDITALINISIDTSSVRKQEGQRDVYEKNYRFLERVKKAYLKLADEFNYIIIDGEKEKELVHKEVWDKLWERINKIKK